MSDTGDMWREIKKDSKAKKQSNYDRAIERLNKLEIPYTCPNSNHVVVDEKIDYWPSTGKFIVRKSNKKGRGIKALLKEIKQCKSQE